jgi:hypothetical protein
MSSRLAARPNRRSYRRGSDGGNQKLIAKDEDTMMPELLIFPVITGGRGRERIYDGHPDVALDMISSRTFDDRIQPLQYVPTILAGPSGTNMETPDAHHPRQRNALHAPVPVGAAGWPTSQDS